MKKILLLSNVLSFLLIGNALAGSDQIIFGSKIKNGAASITVPSSTTTLVGTDTADTLSNKTLSGSLNTFTAIPAATALTGILPASNGGTGSATQNFVDLTTNQSISGVKTFNSNVFDLGVVAIGSSNTATDTPLLIQETGVATDQSVKHDVYSTGNSAGFTVRRARGTLSSPTAVQSNDPLGFISAFGWGSTAFPANSTGNITFSANQTFTDAAMGTNIDFKNAPNGSITKATNMRLAASGNLLVGSTTDNATDKIQATGSIKATTSIKSASSILNGSTSGTFTQTVPATVTSYSVSWPSAQGAASTFLKNDGSGNLSWSTVTQLTAVQETPSGTINGSNVTFTLAFTPSSSASVNLYLDGTFLRQGTDYTISTVTITMSTAPALGQTLDASYTK